MKLGSMIIVLGIGLVSLVGQTMCEVRHVLREEDVFEFEELHKKIRTILGSEELKRGDISFEEEVAKLLAQVKNKDQKRPDLRKHSVRELLNMNNWSFQDDCNYKEYNRRGDICNDLNLCELSWETTKFWSTALSKDRELRYYLGAYCWDAVTEMKTQCLALVFEPNFDRITQFEETLREYDELLTKHWLNRFRDHQHVFEHNSNRIIDKMKTEDIKKLNEACNVVKVNMKDFPDKKYLAKKMILDERLKKWLRYKRNCKYALLEIAHPMYKRVGGGASPVPSHSNERAR